MVKQPPFRFYWERLGAHIHIRCFVGTGLAGTLVMLEDEWEAFQNILDTLSNKVLISEEEN